jgi:hypothetical protein
MLSALACRMLKTTPWFCQVAHCRRCMGSHGASIGFFWFQRFLGSVLKQKSILL